MTPEKSPIGSGLKPAQVKGGVVTSRATAISPHTAEESSPEGMSGSGTPRTPAGFVDNGGPILTNAHVYLIFWGSAWAGNATPSAAAITTAVTTILTSSYMSALAQYRGIGQATLSGRTVVATSDPPNPFSDAAVIHLISLLTNEGVVPAAHTDDQLLYCVMMPTGVNSDGGFIGEHSFFVSADGHNVHYAWVMNDGSLDFVTSIFSHELVESCTDPEGSAITGTVGTCSQDGWCEIGDVCEGYWTTLDGVSVQKYWSQRDRTCIIPGPWESLGGKFISPPGAFSQAVNSLNLFALGTDHAIWHKRWDGTKWEDWTSLGGTFIAPPHVISQAANSLDLFALSTDHTVQHRRLDGNTWGAWESFGDVLATAISAVSQPAAGPGGNGLDLFALGADHAIWHKGEFWGDWESLGGTFISPPTAITCGTNRTDLFALRADHVTWHKWRDGFTWSDWESLGGTFSSQVSAVSWDANRLDLFAIGTDNAIWHKWWDGASWGGWESLGGSAFSTLTALSWGPQRLDLFALGSDSTVWHKWRDITGWGGWESLGGALFSPISAVHGAIHLMDIFAIGVDSSVWHKWWG